MATDGQQSLNLIDVPKEFILDIPFQDRQNFTINLLICSLKNGYANSPSTKYSDLQRQVRVIFSDECKLPDKINCSIKIKKSLFDDLKLGKYLARFAALNDWEISNWNSAADEFHMRDPAFKFGSKSLTSPVYVNFHDIDPRGLTAAFILALKENASTAGINTSLLGLESIEKIPGIILYANQYNRAYKSVGIER